MAAEAARVHGYADSIYGTAAPAEAPRAEPAPRYADIPDTREHARSEERSKTAAAQKSPAVSLFAVFGALFAGVLMVFVVLAQISYNAVASETVKLDAQLAELIKQGRRLEIEFESSIDMKEVERYARDTLGMSKPDTDQIAIVQGTPADKAEILNNGSDNTLSGSIGSFISSLLEYFK